MFAFDKGMYVIKIIHQSEIISLKHVGRLSPCFVTLSIPDFFVSQIEETIIDDQPLQLALELKGQSESFKLAANSLKKKSVSAMC